MTYDEYVETLRDGGFDKDGPPFPMQPYQTSEEFLLEILENEEWREQNDLLVRALSFT